jgi:beta-lactamase regulating signal transducer with metallopeptidase domain
VTAALVLDTSIKAGAIGLLAWAATARAGLADARRAHQIWGAAAAAFVFLPLTYLCLTPAAAVVPAAAVAARLPSVDTVPWWLAAVYVTGVAVLLARTALGVIAVRSLFARALALDDDPGAADLCAACARGGAVLVESAFVGAPATAGALRPHVLLPAGWRELPRDTIDAAVRHELAHVARRDYLVLLAIDVIGAVWWFHPVAWLARRRVRWFAELACDADAAVAVGSDDYARALVALARNAVCPGYGLVLSATSAVRQRVELLLAGRSGRSLRLRAAVLVGVALLAMVAVVRVGPRALVVPAVAASHTSQRGGPEGSRDNVHAATHAARHRGH